MPNNEQLSNRRRAALILRARAGLIPASDAIEYADHERMKRIGRVVRGYAKLSGRLGNRDHLAITDILAALRHYCDRGSLAFHELDAAAEQNYLDDIAEIRWGI